MSASPGTARRSDEELDLFLSRSLDGDLSPDEERELMAILASDPRAVRRREEVAALVGKLGALPAPAAPLGLTARVGARAADQAKGMGSLWRRLGIFPPPAMVRGVAALFVIVLIGINVLRSQSARQKAVETAAQDDGRVTIFFDEKKPAQPAAPAPAPARQGKLEAGKEKRAPAPATLRPEEQLTASEERDKERDAAAVADLSKIAQRGDAPASSDRLALREEAAGFGGAARSEAVAGNLKAQAAPAPVARKAAAVPVSWDVTIVGPSASAWGLKKMSAPAAPGAGISATYRLTLDADGVVVSAQAIEGGTAETDALVKSLVFGAVSQDAPREIEVTVRTR